MKRYLLDSNSLNLFAYRRLGVYERAMERRKKGADIGTAIPVVAEIFGGLEFSVSKETNKAIMERELKLLRLWPFDLAAARRYADVYAALKKIGINMQVFDLQIAAVALVIPHCTVVSSDSDFTRVPGLSVENWIV